MSLLQRKKIDWFQDTSTYIKKYHTAYRKTYAAVLGEIHRLTFSASSKIHNKLSVIYLTLQNIVINYCNRFQEQYLSGSTLFDRLTDIFNTNDSEKQAVNKSAKLFSDYFNNTQEDEDDMLLSKALDILSLLLRCSDFNDDKYYIIAFDNFERFINDDELYNGEIDQIRKDLASYDIALNDISNHNLKFKFIMTIRCSTARLCKIRVQPADENASNLDISSWFDINDIIQKKITWFEQNGIKNKSFELFYQTKKLPALRFP